jgi:Rps23 Pro-64 3,4-dihydroxylase Tpa1-like proline 4-hydroxylase
MTPESHPAWVELTVPGLDHDRNLKLMVSKQDRFSLSTLTTRRSLNAAYKQEKRNSLSLMDDPDVAQISGAIESTITARLATILEALQIPPFRVGETESSCVCFRNGSFFRSHFDVVRTAAGKRRLSWVYYLNTEPKRFSGGDLLLGSPGTDRAALEPVHGKIVVFSSETVHEVTTVELDPDDFGDARFSITGFIEDQPTRAAQLRFDLKQLRRRIRRRLRPRSSRRSREG